MRPVLGTLWKVPCCTMLYHAVPCSTMFYHALPCCPMVHVHEDKMNRMDQHARNMAHCGTSHPILQHMRMGRTEWI